MSADDDLWDDEDECEGVPDGEPCDHDCFDEDCEEGPDGRFLCLHEHCGNCGGCRCPGYCDDEQTYNLRFAETGGADPQPERS